MNKRLLEYKHQYFDYSKIHLKKYQKKNYSRLLMWYFYNKYGLRESLYILRKHTDRNFIRILDETFPDIVEYMKTLDLYINNRNSIYSFIDGNSKCKHCNKTINIKQKFCSVKCSNTYKSTQPEYITKLSLSLQKYHKNISYEEKTEKYKKVSDTIKDFYKNENEYDKSQRLLKNKPKLTSYDNMLTRIEEFIPLFNKDCYYNNRELKFECNKCSSITTVTKSTGPINPICRVCNPVNQEKTQNELFNMIHIKNKKMNDRTKIYPYEIDILLDDMVGVEYCGIKWHSYGKSKYNIFNNYDMIDSNRHINKLKLCENKNINLLTFFDTEYKDKMDIVVSMINSKIGLSDKIMARKCTIKEVPNKDSDEFLKLNHIQSSVRSSIRVGLYYNDELVSIMTFGKPRMSKKYQYELYRMCNKIGINVVGGFSKMLKYFERKYTPISLISYANRRWSQGNVYEVNGFTFSHNTPPNMFWFNNSNIIESRQKFQKHKLKDIEGFVFDEKLTAKMNMFNNGYRVIYDCGNKVYFKVY